MRELIYKGQVIEQRDTDGYVNATQMCQANGKEISHWLLTEDCNRYVDAISQKLSIPRNSLIVRVSEGFPAKKSTWIHPELAIKLARWISVEFELWCDTYIKTLMETGTASLKSYTPAEMLLLYAQQFVEMERKQLELEAQQQKQAKEIEALTAELAALKAIINQPIPTCPQTLRQKLVETVQLLARVFVQKGVCATYPEANKEVWTRLLTKIKFSPARRDIPLLKHNKEKKYQEDLLKYEQDRAAGLKTKKPLKKDYFLNSPEWIQHLNLEQLAYTCLMSVVKDAFTLLAV